MDVELVFVVPSADMGNGIREIVEWDYAVVV